MEKSSLVRPTLPSDLAALQEEVEGCLNFAIRLIALAKFRNLTAELAIELVSSLKRHVAEAKAKLAAVSSDVQREGAPIGIVLRWMQIAKQEVAICPEGPLRGVMFRISDMSKVQNTSIVEFIVGQQDEEILGKNGLAVEAAIEFAKRVYESCCMIADPLGNIPIDGGYRKLDPKCIGQHFDAVVDHLRSIVSPDLRRAHLV